MGDALYKFTYLLTYFRKFILETRRGMAERAVVDFQREKGTSKDGNIRGTSAAMRLKSDKIMECSVQVCGHFSGACHR